MNKSRNHLSLHISFLLLLSLSSCQHPEQASTDWLIDGSSYRSVVREENDRVIISNGLVSRTISLKPEGATIGFRNIAGGTELLRAVKPEAIILVDKKVFRIGGLTGQPVKNYLTEEWLGKMKRDNSSSLVEYQGGGAEATIEPLKDHLPHYGQHLADLFGAGVQAAWRGNRLYDATETLQLVRKWVSFYKKHRRILDADIIHVKRPDGQDIDAILHADPAGEEKGLLMVYNPLDHPVRKDLKVNVYYTGLSEHAVISENDGPGRKYVIGRNYEVTIPVRVEANSQSWYIFKRRK